MHKRRKFMKFSLFVCNIKDRFTPSQITPRRLWKPMISSKASNVYLEQDETSEIHKEAQGLDSR